MTAPESLLGRPAGALLLLTSGLLGLAVLGCSGAPAAADAEIVVAVKAQPATVEPITALATAQGGVFAKQEASLSAVVAGKLGDVKHLQNTKVGAGQVLAVLDAVDFFAVAKDERQAQAAVASAEALEGRRKALYDQGGISKKDLEDTELQLSNARDDLVAAQRTLGAMTGSASVDASGRAQVRAPFAGVITQQMQFGGEFVDAGAALFKLEDLTGYIVKASFPDTVGAKLTEGSPATVKDEAFDDVVTGTVTMVSKTSDPGSRTMEVWVTVDNADGATKLRAGDAATVTAPTATVPDAVVVPSQAVQLDASTGTDGKVMIVTTEQDKSLVAHETKVTIGLRAGGKTQIVDGVKAGDLIVTEGNYGLPDESKVTIEADEPDKPDGGDKPADKPADAGDKPAAPAGKPE